MKLKKVITGFLILLMVFQLLPVRQAVRYFFIDNMIAEEMLHVIKDAPKHFNLLGEDTIIADIDFSSYRYLPAKNIPIFHFKEVLPPIQAADISTPPPNRAFT